MLVRLNFAPLVTDGFDVYRRATFEGEENDLCAAAEFQ